MRNNQVKLNMVGKVSMRNISCSQEEEELLIWFYIFLICSFFRENRLNQLQPPCVLLRRWWIWYLFKFDNLCCITYSSFLIKHQKHFTKLQQTCYKPAQKNSINIWFIIRAWDRIIAQALFEIHQINPNRYLSQ